MKLIDVFTEIKNVGEEFIKSKQDSDEEKELLFHLTNLLLNSIPGIFKVIFPDDSDSSKELAEELSKTFCKYMNIAIEKRSQNTDKMK